VIPSEVVERLRRDRWADPGGRVKDPGPLVDAIDGRQSYVVVLPEGASLAEWRALWRLLDLQDEGDLLVLFDGRRWEARGWGLSSAEISAALDQAEPALRDGFGAGLAEALGQLEAAQTGGATFGSVALGAGAVAAMAALGGLGWILVRRIQREREGRAEVEKARASLDDTVAELILTSDELGESGHTLQEKAVALQAAVRSVPADLTPRVRAARIEQLENEVVALQSEVMQRQLGGAETPERLRSPRRNPIAEG
jgi:hypothetical protein